MKKKILATLGLTTTLLLSACTGTQNEITKEDLKTDQPNGVYYEIFVRAFADSDGDGIGDFKGATDKLDYLADLGIEGIWLMPINSSPSYHGYDVTDYKDIDPEYGTMDDFKKFVEEAHKRNIKVIMDLVVNHTSKEHPWFQKALTEDKTYKDFYNFATESTDTTAIGEWGQVAWNGTETEKYESVFWEGMPDLNFDNPSVRKEIKEAGTFWLKETNVDGFRLDAAKHIYSKPYVENDEEKDHAWWAEFHAEMKKANPNVFLVGEVWDNTSVVGPYLKEGLTSAFNFDTSDKILSSVKTNGDAGVTSDIERTREYFKLINPKYIDSTFITNHDMDRTMSQIDTDGEIDEEDVNKAKMAASLLLTLPGNPFIYYGEEIGMLGKKPDEYIREPFIWDINPEGKYNTKWITPFENTDRKNTALETQIKDENSLYNHYKKIIYARRANEILINGEIKSAPVDKDGFVLFERVSGKKSLFVLHNMSNKENALNLTEQFMNDYTKYNNVYFTSSKDNKLSRNKIKMAPYSTIILETK